MKKIILKVKKAKSFFENMFGLIIEPKNTSMLFQTRWGIHTFFMSRPIDVLILDAGNTVVIQKNSLKPYKLFLYPPKFNTVIELPEQFITEKNIKLGDKIEIDAQG